MELDTCLFILDLECALEVSNPYLNEFHCQLIQAEDFALSEASYAIIRIVQTFPNVRLPPDMKKEKTGQERQNLTIVVSSAEGCKVLLA